MRLVYFQSLGCDKNLVDSEKMLGLLADAGYRLTDEAAEADVIIVNTCSFIGDAKQESIDEILRLSAFKQSGRCRALIAAGCLAERYRDEITRELPELDGVLGTASYDQIAEVADQALAKETPEPVRYFADVSFLPHVKQRLLSTGGHYAYLKIAEGCDKCCAYCAIPQARGHYRSVPMEELLEEAERLAEQGVKELILVAQETTRYGVDLSGRKMLPELLEKLEEIPGIRRIRLLYAYPEEITDELIACMAASRKICHYLDIPVQHAADSVLARMERRTRQKTFREQIEKLRNAMPDIALRTTLLTGFPGETEEEHAENLAFVREMQFDRLGVFCFSREEGTPAYAMHPQIPKRIKEKRRRELMLAQQEVAFEKEKQMSGRVLEVMVEGRLPEEDVYVARTYRDAPDVDGLLFFADEAEWETGDFVTVRVSGAREYDLTGEVCDESAE